MTASTRLGQADLPGDGVLSTDSLQLVSSLAGSPPVDLVPPTGATGAVVVDGAARRSAAPMTLPFLLVAEASAASVVALCALLLAATTPATVSAVAVGWLGLLAARLSAAPPLDGGHPWWTRARSGSTLGLCCGVAASVWPVPATARELVVLITALTATSTAVGVLDARLRRRHRPRVVAVGAAATALADVVELERCADVVAVCVPGPGDREQLPDDFAWPVIVGLDELAPASAAREADAVVVLADAATDARTLRRLIWDLEAVGRPVLVGTGLRDVLPHRTCLTRAAGLNLVHVRPARRRGAACLLKAIAERAIAAVALVLLLPLLAVLVVVIRLESPGPAIFRQRRAGRFGSAFTLYKFRTMTVDAEDRVAQLADHNDLGGGPLFKIRQDPRVTRVGRVLRRYSLDELPQLVNVLCGQMSLVGPRPALPSEVAAYQDDPRRRLVVKPGLTGLWQVSGRSDLSWEETVRLDLQYVDNWSLPLDLAILWRTVGAVLSHRGAY